MSLRCYALILIVLAGAAAAPAGPASIAISKETTRITEPLDDNGEVDYVAALNEAYGKGVTAEKNAAIPILKALGPRLLDAKVPAEALKALGVKLSATDVYFADYPLKAGKPAPAYEAARKGPWKKADHPAVAKWLAANKAPLDLLASAAKRTRLHIPLTSLQRPAPPAATKTPAPAPKPRPYRQGVQALIIRAQLAAGEGQFDAGWADLLAAHRLATLLGQDPTLEARLTGAALVGLASRATADVGGGGKLTPAQVRTLVGDLRGLPDPPSVVEAVDETERYAVLDAVLRARADPVKAFTRMLKAMQDEDWTPPEEDVIRKTTTEADWNAVCKRVNAHFDLVVAAMKKPTFKERQKASSDIEAKLKQIRQSAKDGRDYRRGSESLSTRRVGTVLMASLLPQNPCKLKGIADADAVRRDLAVMVLGVKAYKADKGFWPQAVDHLAPRYLRTVPTDPFSGKSFILKQVGKRHIIYSVGPNGRDDGGRKAAAGADDVVVRISR